MPKYRQFSRFLKDSESETPSINKVQTDVLRALETPSNLTTLADKTGLGIESLLGTLAFAQNVGLVEFEDGKDSKIKLTEVGRMALKELRSTTG